MHAGADQRRAVGININGGFRWSRAWASRTRVGRGSGMGMTGPGAGRVLEESGPILPRLITKYSEQIIVAQYKFLKYSQKIIFQ